MSSLAFPSLDSAITKFENVGGDYGATLNNPGGLMYGGKYSAAATGQGPTGLAKFPTMDAGTQAMDALVQHYANAGYSLSDMINTWAPPSAGNPNNANYISQVSKQTGLDPNAPIAGAGGSQWNPLNWDWSSGLGAIQTGNQGAPVVRADAAPGTGVFSFGRIGAFLLGLILIAGGVYLFKQPEINAAIKQGMREAPLAAA